MTKTQTVFPAETVQRLLRAGVAQVAADPEKRSAMEAQLVPLALDQTFTYWTNADQRIYQATSTLLTADLVGQPTPWLEVIWRFFAYDDPGIAIAAPSAIHRCGGLIAGRLRPRRPWPRRRWTPDTTLRVRSFAAPSVPLETAAVTIYPAGGREALGVDHRSRHAIRAARWRVRRGDERRAS